MNSVKTVTSRIGELCTSIGGVCTHITAKTENVRNEIGFYTDVLHEINTSLLLPKKKILEYLFGSFTTLLYMHSIMKGC